MSIRTLIADDHQIFRSGLRALLEKEGNIEVVAEAGDGFQAIRMAATHPVDVLILDLSMPGLHGCKVAETVRLEQPHLAIIILTMYDDDYYLRELFRIGVRGFVLKKSSDRDLVRAIRAVHRGEDYVDPSLTGRLLPLCHGHSTTPPPPRSELLTRREKEVCALLAYGYTNAEIAQKLFVSVRTVDTHRAHIMAKLDSGSRAELVRFAIENGMLTRH